MKTDELVLKFKSSISQAKNDLSAMIGVYKNLDTATSKTTENFDKLSNPLTKLQNELKSTQKEYEKLEKAMSSFKYLTNKEISSFQPYLQMSTGDLKSMYAELQRQQDSIFNRVGGLRSKAFKQEDIDYQNQLIDLSNKLSDKAGEITSKQIDIKRALSFKDIAGDMSYKEVLKNLDEFPTKIDNIKNKINQLSNEPATGSKFVQKTKKDLQELDVSTDESSKNLRRLNNDASSSLSVFSKLGSTLNKVGKIFSNFTKKFTKGMLNNYYDIKKLALGLIGIRTVMSMLTKSVNAYLSFDLELQESLNNSWNMLGALLAPAIELVARMFALATNYIAAFINALTGIDLIARANAKALETQAKATAKANNAQFGLLGMDEITNLPTKSAGPPLNQITTEAIEIKGIFADLIEALKKQQWHIAGEIIANGIDKALGDIDWNKIHKNAYNLGYNIADFLNGLFELNWSLLGRTLGNGINTAIEFAYGFVEKFSFIQFGKGLATALTSAFTTIDWKKLAITISDGIINVLLMITTFFDTADWEEIGSKIREFFVNIKWGEIAKATYNAIRSAFGGFSDFIAGLFDIDPKFAQNFAIAFSSIALSLLGVKAVLSILNKFSKEKDEVKNATETISTGLNSMFESFGKASTYIAVLGGLSLVINSIGNLFKSFGDSGLSISDGLLLLGSTLAMISLSFITLSKSIQAIPLTSLVGFVAIMSVLSATLSSVSQLFNAFENSSLSVSGAIGLLATVFGGLIVLMGAVTILGPSMTAGLIPFATIVGLVSASLIVLSLTLPPILDACGTFIQNIAPSMISVITAIYTGISNIVYALGTSLPPIIQSIGSVFEVIFSGIRNIIESVGNVIVEIMTTADKSTSNTLSSILNFIVKLGPAINTFVDNAIVAVTKLINFMISGVEYLVNTLVIPGINAIIETANTVPLVDIPIADKITIPKFIPKLETGTNNIESEGLYHLHPGEAVVPKRYNPATGGYDNSADNRQIIDLLIALNSSMLEYANRPMNITMNSKKVAEAIYDDSQEIRKNRNASDAVVRS